MNDIFESADNPFVGEYMPGDLVCAVHKYPTWMSDDLKSRLGTIFSTQLTGIGGFRSGYTVDPDSNGRLALTPFPSNPYITVREVCDRAIAKTMLEWAEGVVAAADVEKDGLELVIFEPTVSYSTIADAWYLTDVYPSVVGACDKSRNISDAYRTMVPVIYELELRHKECYYNNAEIKSGVTPRMIAAEALSDLNNRLKNTTNPYNR